jgi:hypothetical protein
MLTHVIGMLIHRRVNSCYKHVTHVTGMLTNVTDRHVCVGMGIVT